MAGKSNHRNHSEKRETSKWIILYNHRKYWKCIILVKENSGKYWLPWWWINRWENVKKALKRELIEELGKEFSVELMHTLFDVETPKQYHKVHALKLSWKLKPSKKEIKWFAFYPLDKKYEDKRKKIEKDMEYYAKHAVRKFMAKPNIRDYQVSPVSISTLKRYFCYNLFWALKL